MTRWAFVKRFKGVWDIIKTKDGVWVLFEDHEKAAAAQRQIIDEQVEENRGLRNDVLLMQKVNAEQREEIERLQAQLATAKGEMIWTNDKPTNPGWYWVRWPKSPQYGPEIRELVQPDGPGTDLHVDADYICPVDEYIANHGTVEWQGPLKPKEPS